MGSSLRVTSHLHKAAAKARLIMNGLPGIGLDFGTTLNR